MATSTRKVPEGKQRVTIERGIYLKANGKYLVTYRDPGHRQRWKEFTTLRDARLFRARATSDPRSVLQGKRTLREIWETFLIHNAAALRATTLANWTLEWSRYIDPWFGTWPVGRITILDVKDFLADLEKRGTGPATRQKVRTVLGRVCEEALENGEIAANPVAAKGTRVKMPQPTKARILTVDEYRQVRDVAHAAFGASDGLAIELMFLLGLRIGEMAGLQVRDIDVARCEIAVTRTVSDAGGKLLVHDGTKSSKVRTLPVPAELEVWTDLTGYIRGGSHIGETHIFASPSGRPIRPNNWRRRVWAKTMLLAEIADPPTPHGARRTTASLLSQAGVPQATIRRILGHATLAQTGEYIDVPRAAVEDGLRQLGSVLASKAAPRVRGDVKGNVGIHENETPTDTESSVAHPLTPLPNRTEIGS